MYFNDVFNDFIKDEIIFRGLSSSTLEGYKYFRRLFNRYVGNVGVLLGHTSLDTTRVYIHYTNPQLRAVYDSASV